MSEDAGMEPRIVATLAARHWQSDALATRLDLIPQSTYIPEYHGVCTSSELGPLHPLSCRRVGPHPGTKVGGTHTPAGERVHGKVPIRTTEKKPSTPSTLCLIPTLVSLFFLKMIKV